MRAFVPLALLVPLLGCGGSSEPAGNAATAAAHPAPVASPTSVADTRTVPAPGTLRRFGDWIAGCDNGGTCQAGVLLGDGDTGEPVVLSLERAAGPQGAIVARLANPLTLTVPLVLRVDGQVVARGGREGEDFVLFSGAEAAALARAIAAGRTLAVESGGKAIGTISLDGVSAALRWIDAEQGRAGTTGAIVARGDRPDTRPAPALPVVRLAPTGGEAALLDPQLVTAMRRTADCEDAGIDDLPEPVSWPLGGGRTLTLIPCSAGAYNLRSAVFVVERGKATPAAFDTPVGMDDDGSGLPSVVNGNFADGILSTLDKGRGPGDCGVSQRFAWDGTRFRMIEQRVMNECGGNADFIRTWHARPVR